MVACDNSMGTCALAAAVYLDGKRLRMEPNESEQEHIMAVEQGEMMLLWQLHRPDAGQAVQITTGARLS
jgi:hypothetical protein